MMHVPPPVVALAAGLVQRALTGATPRPSAGRAGGDGRRRGGVPRRWRAGRPGLFRHSGTTVDPLHPDRASALVTTGPNAISRNPMYVGMAGVLAAHAIWRGSWAALLPVAGFVAVVDRLQVAAEEPALLGRFGAEYESYRASTPRWVGLRSLHVART